VTFLVNIIADVLNFDVLFRWFMLLALAGVGIMANADRARDAVRRMW